MGVRVWKTRHPTIPHSWKVRAMTKLENDSRIVNKEIFKITAFDSKPDVEWSDITENTRDVLEKLFYILNMKSIRSYRFHLNMTLTFPIIKKDEITFKKIAAFESKKLVAKKTTLENVRKAAKELTEKGYLVRDTDGTLIFPKKIPKNDFTNVKIKKFYGNDLFVDGGHECPDL